MAASEVDEHIFKTGLACAQVFELLALMIHGLQQRGNGQVRLTHVEADRAVLAAHGLDAGQISPRISSLPVARDFEFDYVMTTEAIDQFRRRSRGNDLAVIDDGEAIAEAFGFVHVGGGGQDGAAFWLEVANDFPELAAALRVETGGGLI